MEGSGIVEDGMEDKTKKEKGKGQHREDLKSLGKKKKRLR